MIHAEPSPILEVSLPDGGYVGSNSDSWLDEGWLRSLTGTSQTFAVRVNNTSAEKRSYNTHVIIALNEAGYHNLQSLVVNGISVPQSAFKYGTPRPFNLWDWPSDDVFPTWYDDTSVNVGTISYNGYKTIVISVAFSSVTGIRMHFDAYGSTVLGGPSSLGHIAHNRLSEDSTVLFNVESSSNGWCTRYLTVKTNPEGITIIPGEGWYEKGANVDLEAPLYVPDEGGFSGYRYKFDHWDVDGDTVGGNPIVVCMTTNHTANAHYTLQYYLTITHTAGGVTDPAASGWYEAETAASVTAVPDPGYVLDRWELDGTPIGSTNPYNVLMNSAHTLHAVFICSPQTYYLTVKTDPLGVTSIPGEGWYDAGEEVVLTTPNFVDVSLGTRYEFAFWDIDGAPQGAGVNPIMVTMNVNRTATAHYTLQHYLTVRTNPSGLVAIWGEGWYDASAGVPLAAPDAGGYDFRFWDVDGISQGDDIQSIFVVMDTPHTATANYEPITVGGATVSVQLLPVGPWMVLNVLLFAAVFITASWVKRLRKR